MLQNHLLLPEHMKDDLQSALGEYPNSICYNSFRKQQED